MTIALFLASRAAAQEIGTPEELRALLTFRDEHLAVREEEQISPGRITLLGPGWMWGPGDWTGYTWANAQVISSPPEVMRSWAVYRGPERLAVPDFLDLAGRADEARTLELRVRRNATISRVFGGVAVAGLAAGIGGFAGTVADPARETTWTSTAIGGLGASILSGIVSGGTRSRSERLAHDYARTQDLAAAQRDVREANERLREELGLTPAEAYRELDRAPLSAGQSAQSRSRSEAAATPAPGSDAPIRGLPSAPVVSK